MLVFLTRMPCLQLPRKVVFFLSVYYHFHQLNGHEFEQNPGGSKGQGSLVLYIHGMAESDMTQLLNNNVTFYFEIFPNLPHSYQCFRRYIA